MAKKAAAGGFDTVKKEVKKLVAEIAEVPASKLKDDANFFDDLGIDSMKALEIVASIEKKYKIRIPEDKIPTIRSLQNVYALLEKLKK
jgi:acyl carrier protein